MVCFCSPNPAGIVALERPVSAFHAGVIAVIHKCLHFDILQPGGLSAISRGLSAAIPPVEIGYHIRPWRGRSNSHKNLSAVRKKLQIPVQTGAILDREGKTATPLGSIFYSFCHPGVSLRSTPG